MAMVVGFSDIVQPSIGGSANLQAFSLSIFWSRNSMNAKFLLRMQRHCRQATYRGSSILGVMREQQQERM
jgi:hypothetical protein